LGGPKSYQHIRSMFDVRTEGMLSIFAVTIHLYVRFSTHLTRTQVWKSWTPLKFAVDRELEHPFRVVLILSVSFQLSLVRVNSEPDIAYGSTLWN